MNTTIAKIFSHIESSNFEFQGKLTKAEHWCQDNLLDRPRQAWQWMRQTLQTPGEDDWVRNEVTISWQRCLDEYRLRFPPSFTRPDSMIPSVTSPNPGLLKLSEIVEQQSELVIGEAGLSLCLMDAECRLVYLGGHDFSACPMGKILIYPLADWSERLIGNSGIGSAAVTQTPIAFCGEEHFLQLLHPFSSAGFPLFDQDGKLHAVLGLISDQRVNPGVLKSLICMLGTRVQAILQASAPTCPTAPVSGFIRSRSLNGSEHLSPQSGKNRFGVDAGQALLTQVPRDPIVTLECRLAERAVRLQERRIPILVVGESGAGKEHLIRMAYETGPRRNGPFIALNCASLPRELIESELFGYASGSFTGARKEGKAGKFLLADKGVLFLDEIGDMGLDLQAVLLRVLENAEFYPVGASQPVKVDVQIFAATNVPIQQAVREGRFRRDLYYRLNGAQIILPPLRDREDKCLIIQRLMDKELELAGRVGSVKLGRAVQDMFQLHPWPGNIRQLSNVIRSALQMAEGGVITPADLPDDFIDELNQGQDNAYLGNSLVQIPYQQMDAIADPAMTLAEWESKGIKAALQSFKGNLSQAAKALGITRGTLYKKMSLYGLGAQQ